MISLVRRYRFSASHLYRRPEWSDEENERRFGACANLPGHGHNYRLWVWVSGMVDGRTGFVIDLGALDGIVRERVLDVVDHHHLNAAVDRFAAGGAIPSSENMLAWIRERLEAALPAGAALTRLRLEEDEDLAAEWEAD
jgi:6-pyruvoyltetrahydropterin/6-carboxytetrahydropterin synthase